MNAKTDSRQRPSAFLKLDTIKGESRIEKYRDQIEIRDVRIGVTQPRSATASTTGGHTTARAEWDQIEFVSQVDTATASLLQNCASGTTIANGRLTFTRADKDGQDIEYYLVDLLNVVVSGVTLTHADDGLLEAHVRLSFGATKQTYTVMQPNGGQGGKVVMQHSQTLGKPTFAV